MFDEQDIIEFNILKEIVKQNKNIEFVINKPNHFAADPGKWHHSMTSSTGLYIMISNEYILLYIPMRRLPPWKYTDYAKIMLSDPNCFKEISDILQKDYNGTDKIVGNSSPNQNQRQ